jgi:hypothetical protein
LMVRPLLAGIESVKEMVPEAAGTAKRSRIWESDRNCRAVIPY